MHVRMQAIDSFPAPKAAGLGVGQARDVLTAAVPSPPPTYPAIAAAVRGC